MKTDWSEIECYRKQFSGMESERGDTFGFFMFKRHGVEIRIIACDGTETGWEHVSVSLKQLRSPTWEEMAIIKAMFWEAEECVIQFHPPESEYVNNHRFCLHLWKCVARPFPLPPSILTGIKTD